MKRISKDFFGSEIESNEWNFDAEKEKNGWPIGLGRVRITGELGGLEHLMSS